MPYTSCPVQCKSKACFCVSFVIPLASRKNSKVSIVSNEVSCWSDCLCNRKSLCFQIQCSQPYFLSICRKISLSILVANCRVQIYELKLRIEPHYNNRIRHCHSKHLNSVPPCLSIALNRLYISCHKLQHE